MIRMLLACASGMSTSLLVTKMKRAANHQNIDADVSAVAEAELPGHLDQIDILLLGPQLRYKEKKFQEMVQNRIPVYAIPARDYGTMNGTKVFADALEVLKKFKGV